MGKNGASYRWARSRNVDTESNEDRIIEAVTMGRLRLYQPGRTSGRRYAVVVPDRDDGTNWSSPENCATYGLHVAVFQVGEWRDLAGRPLPVQLASLLRTAPDSGVLSL